MKLIKEFFLKLVPAKKNGWFLLSLAFLFGLSAPFKFVQAAWGVGWVVDKLMGVVIGIPSFLIVMILNIVTAISILFSGIASSLLEWVVKLDIPLTRCSCSPETTCSSFPTDCLVTFGWTFSRDLANMVFILILIAIAFAYILKLETLGMKKALPLLIGVAILVNFSQVFVGIIVDISQIIMNTFLDNTVLGSGAVFKQIGGVGSNFIDAAKNVVTFSALKQVELIIQVIVIIVFNCVMGVMLLMYFLLFLVRIIALWVITILAPLAFAMLILPQTKSWWTKWLSNLLSWSFLGVIALFFLFFGFFLLTSIHKYNLGEISDVGFGATDLLQSILPYLVTLVFLFIGFQLAISSAPAGAQMVINFGKKLGGKAASAYGLGAARALGRKIAAKGEKWRKKLEEREMKPGKAPAGGLKGAFAKGLGWTGLPKATRLGTRWAGKGMAIGAGRVYREVKRKDEEEINAWRKKATNKDAADNLRMLKEEELKPDILKDWRKIAGVTLGTTDNKDTNDIQKAFLKKELAPEEIGHALLTAYKQGGPPAGRPIAKALYNRLLADPEQFGKEFELKEKEYNADGSIKRDEEGNPIFKKDSHGSPVFKGEELDEKGNIIKETETLVGKIVREIPEKLTNEDIRNKILGSAIDKGKEGGEEFKIGGELVIRQLVEIRGGELASSFIQRPETKEGRDAILDILRTINPRQLRDWNALGLLRFFASTAAQGTAIESPLLPQETNRLRELLRKEERAKTGGETLTTEEQKNLKELIETWERGTIPSGAAPAAPATAAPSTATTPKPKRKWWPGTGKYKP